MIIMNVECNNLLRFKDFSMNFSYPRKINNFKTWRNCVLALSYSQKIVNF